MESDLSRCAAETLPVLFEVQGLDVDVGGQRICSNLNLSLQAGQSLALLGPNGAGKTTLLHTFAGLHHPANGEIRVNGRSYAQWREREAALQRGLLAQHQGDSFSMTVLEAVLTGRHPHIGRWGWESETDLDVAHQSLAALDLIDMQQRDILSLSGGERQRVAIATLLTQAPALFLLDEPLNHLDLHYQIAVLALFRNLVRMGRGIVMVIHDINLAARFADLIVLFDGHGGMTSGPASEILQPDVLSHAFNHRLSRYDIDGNAVFIPAMD